MDSPTGSLDALRLPEIKLTDIDEDWGFLAPEQEQTQETSSPITENDSLSTTGLKRALSLSSSKADAIRTEVINISTSNPSHLFWVPASQHPEIAPAEFEKYVQAHGVIVRKKSAKRQSVLSMYFTANDQKEETLTKDEDEKIRKKTLRRSLSLQLPSSGAVDYARNVPDLLVFDRNSSPFDESRALVPKGDRPLLRRGARTNFKRISSVSPHRNSTSAKSESDSLEEQPQQQQQQQQQEQDSSLSAEGITLSDATTEAPDAAPLSPVEEVRELCISSRNEADTEELAPPIVMTRSVSTSSSRKSSWSWAFWSDEHKASKAKPADSSKRFTLSSLFSRKSKSIHHHTNNSNYTSSIEKITSHLNKAPKDFQLNPMLMTRLPLHVERAVYKLSHYKLANPRRPLHEQVLISNHMFWYLSIIATHNPHQELPKKRLVKKKKQPPPPKKRGPTNSNNTNFLSSAQKASTGFVVPENYLHPKKSSLSSSDDEDDDDISSSGSSSSSSEEEEEEDAFIKQDDDLPLAMYKLK